MSKSFTSLLSEMLKIFAKRGPYQGEALEDGIMRVWRYFKKQGQDKG
jgi:hypothetical protein